MRVKPISAAILAATLLGGGLGAHAVTETANAGWFFTTPAGGDAPTGSNTGLVSVPDLPFGFGLRDAPIAAPFGATATPFAVGASSDLGTVTVSGYSVTANLPPLATAGFLAGDGTFHAVHDFAFVDRLASDFSIELGYDADLGARFNSSGVDAALARDGLFLSAAQMGSPFAALGNGGTYLGTTIGAGDGLSFSLGESVLNPERTSLAAPLLPYLARLSTQGDAFAPYQSNTILGGANWNFAPWGGVGLTAVHNEQHNGLFGKAPLESLALARASTTNGLGISGRIGLGSGWITSFSYNEGVTQLDQRPNGAALNSVSLRSRSYGLAVAKHGLFGDDSLGLSVSRPLELASAGVDLGGAGDPFDGLMAEATRPILSGDAPETDLELGYVTTFLDGAFALQANAGYQMNIAGQTGNNGVTVLSRAKINF
ncbi:MAG TPA: hypothetical protein VGI20_08090 [Rhizomicrobium sp.]